MNYKCCEYLFHQLVFDISEIKPCCEVSMNNEHISFIDNFDENHNISEYYEQKNKIINEFKNGKIPAACSNCPMLKEYNWDDNNISLNRIIMANISKCSCNCIYCVYTHDNPEKKKEFNTRSAYDIKPFLKALKNQNLIEDNLFLVIGGGECAEFPKGELEWLIYFAEFYKGTIQFLSSGIKYSQAIEKKLIMGNAELIISPDAGTKSVYEKIKQVKAFDRVWENIKKYSAASKMSGNFSRVAVKYIIIPGINDSLSEFESFIKCCEIADCYNLHIDIEHFWFKDNKQNSVPENIKQIINLLKRQNKFTVSYSAETEYYLNLC